MTLSEIKHLSKEDIIKNGSIFTPEFLVKLTLEKCKKYIDKNTIIGDFGSGYGAFVNIYKNYAKCFGTETDKTSFNLLKQEFPDIDFYNENSLLNVDRNKYNIGNKKLIIVGNPPYNDVTSIYKKGAKGELICDRDLESRDFGICFLKAYDKLKAEIVCVLHPLAYLIKKSNFNNLKQFKNNYKLLDSTIFSSKEFETIKKTNSEFPVVASLYIRDEIGMDYNYIKQFKFSIFGSKSIFCLNKIKTIDGFIDKYPSKNGKSKLQFYTMRDINALKRNTTFIKGVIPNGIDVDLDNLYKYAWIYYFKMNFNPIKYKFIYGNLSPLYTERIEEEHIKSLLVSYLLKYNNLISQFYTLDEVKKKYNVDSFDFSELQTILESVYIK